MQSRKKLSVAIFSKAPVRSVSGVSTHTRYPRLQEVNHLSASHRRRPTRSLRQSINHRSTRRYHSSIDPRSGPYAANLRTRILKGTPSSSSPSSSRLQARDAKTAGRIQHTLTLQSLKTRPSTETYSRRTPSRRTYHQNVQVQDASSYPRIHQG